MIKKFLLKNGYVHILLNKIKSQHLTCILKINEKKGVFLIDSGASNSCINKNEKIKFNQIDQDLELEASGAGKEKLNLKMTKKSIVKYGSKKIGNFSFLLLDMDHINKTILENGGNSIDGIIGADFLKKTKAIICYDPAILFLKL
tara:strand:- start:6 stop:440 length:435 start_codon:yes stop_codon:yes gene_type:complete